MPFNATPSPLDYEAVARRLRDLRKCKLMPALTRNVITISPGSHPKDTPDAWLLHFSRIRAMCAQAGFLNVEIGFPEAWSTFTEASQPAPR